MNIGNKFKAKYFYDKSAEFTVVGFWDDGWGHRYINYIRDDGMEGSWLEADLLENLI